ncbi:aldo/keto reductase [Streptomyces olivoreticuli]|uniref:aldo/keto reductase n=1 Tax=Streptomyces olivoreticuli TaxID=68246 RepID=UPI0013C32AA5|nr:aldo/keto reductase [Streptomyces olivoreticuli]
MSAALGLGTYRVRETDLAALTAIQGGAAWVDTAPAYQDGRAHHLLRRVLAAHVDVQVSTKTGFFTAAQGRTAVAAGVLSEAQAARGHDLGPAFVRWQTGQSLDDLGGWANVVFVHNPERVSRHPHVVRGALRRAFTVLEEFRAAGRIGGYGVATWSGLDELFSVRDLLELAQQAAGSARHSLIAVQQPVSLVMDRPIRQALDGRGPLVQARAAGLMTFASAPLHGGELPGMVSPELAGLIRPGLSPAAACLLATVSTPSLDVVLLSASDHQHWTEAAQATALSLDARRLREITDVLATP